MRKVLAGTFLAFAFAFAFVGCGGSGSSSTGSTNKNDNGEASKSANQVLADTVKAVNAAHTVRMYGNVTYNKKPASLDMLVAKGDGTKGQLAFHGNPVQLIVIGKDGYVLATPTVWGELAGAKGKVIGQFLNGSWLHFPVGTPQFAPLLAVASPKALFDQFKSSGSALKNKGLTTYNGQSAIALDGGPNGTLYVAASGNPYPVALVKKGSGGATISFGGWNNPVTLVVPAPVVDISQLPA